jgi:nitrite reductase/ring-hydroxylating ferredoxin subunit
MLVAMTACKPSFCSLNRRNFIAVLFSGSAWCRLESDGWSQPMAALISEESAGTLVLRVTDFPVLAAVGGSVALMYDTSVPVLIARVTAGFNVFRGRCPHAGGTVIPSGTQFLCTNHGSRFDHTGLAVAGPATGGHLPQYGTMYPPDEDILKIPLPDMAYRITAISVAAEGRLQISFETVAGVKYEIRYRLVLTGVEAMVPFSTTPAGAIGSTELTATGDSSTVYVQRTGDTGFYVVNVKVRQI